MTPDQTVIAYLEKAGVQPFWIDSAMAYIRQTLSSNASFSKSIIGQYAKVENGHLCRYRARVVVTFPGIKRKDAVANILYTFDPKRRMAHKCELSFTDSN
jgi:hypothetical protein